MYKNKKILGVITARGASKSIPQKNIRPLADKPLIAHTIAAALGSRYLTRAIVSTEDEEIARIAREHGAEVPFVRPKELAQDDTPHIPVVQHALGWLEENEDEQYDYVMILQPTSPLRAPEDIDACIVKIIETGADSVMSKVELLDFNIRKLKRIEDDVIFPLVEEEGPASSRRQDAPKVYKRNCAIYLTRTALVKQGDLFGTMSRPYIMPPERSIDINEPFDFELAEFLLQRRQKQQDI